MINLRKDHLINFFLSLTIVSYYYKLHLLEDIVNKKVNSSNLVQKWTDQDQAIIQNIKGLLILHWNGEADSLLVRALVSESLRGVLVQYLVSTANSSHLTQLVGMGN